MLRLASYDVVFQEIPGEVTLALNLSGCPNRCAGCHSPHLQEDTGEALDEVLLAGLLERYGDAVTCVCFMGGDAAPQDVERLAAFVRRETAGRLKVGWYSGKAEIPRDISAVSYDYIKLGPYVERLGGLDCAATNQRLYKTEAGRMLDITDRFIRH